MDQDPKLGPAPCKAVMALLTFWQSALRLGEWKLTVHTASEEHLGNRSAYVDVMPSYKEARIVLRNVGIEDPEIEEDIVHELLHLVFFQQSTHVQEMEQADQLPFEFALNTTAHALVGMRRSLAKRGIRGLAKRAT
jgi:hypothetical protein